MAVYAKCPDTFNQAYSPYLTPGREYLVLSENGQGFDIDSDPDCEDPGPCYCLWAGCMHLSIDGSLDWQRIEREDEA